MANEEHLAKLIGAKLIHTNLIRANILRAKLIDANLNRVQALEHYLIDAPGKN